MDVNADGWHWARLVDCLMLMRQHYVNGQIRVLFVLTGHRVATDVFFVMTSILWLSRDLVPDLPMTHSRGMTQLSQKCAGGLRDKDSGGMNGVLV
jgi:hypothetical protein